MNVFVLCTGRCGSVTFAQACAHIGNFTSGHETRVRAIGPDRLAYPDGHIEADNRLSWLLGRLDRAYGDAARYVHLTRDPEATARSYNNRWERSGSIIRAYRNVIHMNESADPLLSARDYVDTVTENIRAFLKDKSQWMPFRIETAAEDFERFWNWIGAEGDLEAGLAEWDVQHNRTERNVSPTFGTRVLGALGIKA